MGKRRIYDEDVFDTFSSFGVGIAIYFEAIRYRQQLTPDSPFPFRRSAIEDKTGLTIYQQRRARNLLATVGWLEVERRSSANGGSITHYRISDFAKDLIKSGTQRKRYISFQGFAQ